ncbi:ribbon-helix-helix protein, CopG family [Lacrimispora saccharolytica]|nr:ribbon-helix-helix protein, CopG family [Lacrimispora saccharolytica]
MKPLKTKVSITLDSDLLEELKVLVEQDDRSLSQYINLLLKERVKSEQAKQSKKS